VSTCALPATTTASGVTTFTTTSPTYQTYKGIQVAVDKRLSHKWQANLSYTWNDYRAYTPPGTFSTTSTATGNPTGVQFTNGFTNNTPRYAIKAYGSVQLPWALQAGMNLNIQDGAVRTLSINGPGTVASGIAGNNASTVTYSTLTFQNSGLTRYPATKLVDVNVRRAFRFGRQELQITLDCFNVFNTATVRSFTSSDVSNNGVNGSVNSFNSISSIVPPRVFRIDARFAF